MDSLFHIHSYRCGHAANIPDEEYIIYALKKKFNSIIFTDHAPFPENPFGNRMKYEELQEYIDTLLEMKNKYQNKIEIKIGLEIEYLPSFLDYYKELYENQNIDLLMIGQHFYEVTPGNYSFSYNNRQIMEIEGCSKAIMDGIKSGYFNVVAHPERIFHNGWNAQYEDISKQMIRMAQSNNVWLEKNLSAYRQEFWNLVSKSNKSVIGFDAHSIEHLEQRMPQYKRMRRR